MISEENPYRVTLINLGKATFNRFGQPLSVVGSCALLLKGINLIPSDIDLILPSNITPLAFNREILSVIAKPIDDFKWAIEYEHNIVSVTLTDDTLANSWAEHTALRLGWSFPHYHWHEILVDGVPFLIPLVELQICLRLKSLADKVTILAHGTLTEKEHSHWQNKLLRDLALLETQLISDEYSFCRIEPMSDILDQTTEPITSAVFLLKAVRFAKEALTSSLALKGLEHLELFFQTFCKFREPLQHSSPIFIDLPSNSFRGIVTSEGSIFARSSLQFGDTPKAPFYAYVQPISQCNSKCSHCPYQWTGNHLPWTLLKNCLEELAQNGCLQVNFGAAGEAFMYPYLDKAIHETATLGMLPTVNSNLTIEPSATLWDAILKYCALVATSLDTYHFPNNKGSWPKSVYRRIQRISNAGISVTVTIVYKPSDLCELVRYLPEIRAAGANRISLIRLLRYQDEAYPTTPIQFIEGYLNILNCAGEIGLDVSLRTSDPLTWLTPLGFTNYIPGPFEISGRHSIFLDAEGGYRPAQTSPKEERMATSLLQAWESPVFEKHRIRGSNLRQTLSANWPHNIKTLHDETFHLPRKLL